MSSSVTLTPSAMSVANDNGVPWTGALSAVQASGGTALTANTGDLTPELTDTQRFDFSPSIPAGATIDGIEFVIRAKSSAAGVSTIYTLTPGVDNVDGVDQAPGSALTGTLQNFTYGGATELWGFTPTAEDVNAGVSLKVGVVGSPDDLMTQSLDLISCTIYYTEVVESNSLGAFQKFNLLEHDLFGD